MNTPGRFVTYFALAGSILVGVTRSQPEIARRLGLDWWCMTDYYGHMSSMHEERVEMEVLNEEVKERLLRRVKLCARACSGDYHLLDVASEFRRLNAEDSFQATKYRVMFPGNSDEEKLCRQVITWVSNQPGGAKIGRRFEAQLKELLDRQERIELPE